MRMKMHYLTKLSRNALLKFMKGGLSEFFKGGFLGLPKRISEGGRSSPIVRHKFRNGRSFVFTIARGSILSSFDEAAFSLPKYANSIAAGYLR